MNEFAGIFERDGDWYIGCCPEMTGTNSEGRTLRECRESLAEAVRLISEVCEESQGA